MGRSVGLWTMIAVCATSSRCQAPAGKTCQDTPICRSPLSPASSWRIWHPLSERAPAAVLPRKTGLEEETSIILRISILRPIREGSGFASAAFATPGDSAMLESCPSRPPANREWIRLRRCPVGSNAQVPANWAFLQILAQSPHFLPSDRTTHAAGTVRPPAPTADSTPGPFSL
jgi:hypothetical protein